MVAMNTAIQENRGKEGLRIHLVHLRFLSIFLCAIALFALQGASPALADIAEPSTTEVTQPEKREAAQPSPEEQPAPPEPLQPSSMATAQLPKVETAGDALALFAANDWQIVSGQFRGNDKGNKILSPDKSVRIQKNVVPTERENEFLIYLSIDRKTSLEKYLDDSKFLITTSGKYKEKDLGTYYESIVGNSGAVNEKNNATGNQTYNVIISVYDKKGGSLLYTYHDTRRGTVPNCSNASVFMQLPGITGGILSSFGVNLHTEDQGSGTMLEMNVYLDKVPIEGQYETSLTHLTDSMGPTIEYLGLEQVDGTFTEDGFDTQGNERFIWNITEKTTFDMESSTDHPYEEWLLNVAECVYRVRLDVAAPKFTSSGHPTTFPSGSLTEEQKNATNTSATLSYQVIDLFTQNPPAISEVRTVTPKSPFVRGLLYSAEIMKTDDASVPRPLEGAVFGLCDATGSPILSNATQVTATSGKDGVAKFRGLSWGQYTVTELQAPVGYCLDKTNVGPSYTLCYTTHRDLLGTDHEGDHAVDAPGDSLFALTEKPMPTLKNSRAIALRITKQESASKAPLAKASFELRADNGNGVFDSEDKLAAVFSDEPLLNPLEGALDTDENGKAAFYGVRKGVYWIVETKAPAGYQLLKNPVKFALSEDGIASFHEPGIVVPLENGIVDITIENNKIAVLPHTGGAGTGPLYLFGATALCTSTAFFLARIRIKAKE